MAHVHHSSWWNQSCRKGLKMALEERGVSTVGKGADWMRETLAKHSDFRDEKSMVECMLVEGAHIPCVLPKIHPELNPIERVWAQLKRYTNCPLQVFPTFTSQKIFLWCMTLFQSKTFETIFAKCVIICSATWKGSPLERSLIKCFKSTKLQ